MLSFYFYLSIGIALVALELATTTFYLLVIGISCILASFSALLLHDWTIPTIAAGGLSILGCVAINRHHGKNANKGAMMVKHIGQSVEVIEVNSNNLRVIYSGSYWNAVTKTTFPVKVGDILRISNFTNHELEVEKESVQ